MAAPKTDVTGAEDAISECLLKTELLDEDVIRIAYCLGAILDGVFPTLDKNSGLKGWCVDDMYADRIEQSTKKLTLLGAVHWLNGGNDCVTYQADIAKDTNPLLYSYKFKDNRGKQSLYIGKTFEGWVVNA